MDKQRQDEWGQGFILIVCDNGMTVVRGGLHEEFGYIIDRDVVDTALYVAQQVMVKVGNEDSLI